MERSPDELSTIEQLVRNAAEQHRGNSLALLKLLRLLEGLHQDIREGLFQECLPSSRQLLYAMLRDMEAEGGWPYIHRMKLRSLLSNFPEELVEAETHSAPVIEPEPDPHPYNEK